MAKVTKKRNAPAKKLLHVGCGSSNKDKLPKLFQSAEWKEVRLDINPDVKPDIVASMTDMQAVETASMDGVFSSHNIEHLYPHEVPVALAEFRRVLKPGGMLMLTLPDLQAVAAYIAEGKLESTLYTSPAGEISPIDIVYGFRKDLANGNRFMAHNSGFTAVTLANHLRQAGFSTISVQREWVNLWAVAYNLPKGHPQRREKIAIDNRDITGPKTAPLPFWYKRQLQAQGNPATRSDELDAPPRIWKPLGLSAGNKE